MKLSSFAYPLMDGGQVLWDLLPSAPLSWGCGEMTGMMCPRSALSIWIICCLSSLKRRTSWSSTSDRSRLDWRMSDSGNFSTAGMSNVGDQQEWVLRWKFIQPQRHYSYNMTSKVSGEHKPVCCRYNVTGKAVFCPVTLWGIHYHKQASKMTFSNTRYWAVGNSKWITDSV